MLEKYLDNQEIVTKLLLNSIETNKLSQAYLFVCDDIEYIYTYAKEFVKEIIKTSKLDDKILDNIYKRIDNDEYTELKVVKPQGQFIKKEQLLELQNSVLNKPVEANKIVYIIQNAEKLNSSSANSILKFLEEPEDDIIAILLTDNLSMVIPTIKSRCQILNFKNVRDIFETEDKLKTNLLVEDKSEEEIEILINNSIEVANSLEKKKLNTLIYEKDLLQEKFKDNSEIMLLLNFLTDLYMDSLYKKLNKDIKYMINYEEILDLVVENNEINDIISKINLFEQLKKDLKYNVNSKLIFDKLIIEFNEVK